VAGTLPGGGTEWGNVDELSVDQTEKIASKLRASLAEYEASSVAATKDLPSKGNPTSL
jgi:histidine triad (HIT) family protein